MKKIMIITAIFLVAAAFVFNGCSLKKTVINSTGLFMDDVVEAFMAEEDLKFAEQAGPANLKLLDGLIRGSAGDNDGLLLKGPVSNVAFLFDLAKELIDRC